MGSNPNVEGYLILDRSCAAYRVCQEFVTGEHNLSVQRGTWRVVHIERDISEMVVAYDGINKTQVSISHAFKL